MSVKIVIKDLLESDAKYICHQCNCVTKHSAGLAAKIFSKFPYANIYKTRSHTDWRNSRDKPGTILICGNGKDKRFVINLFAQVFPGKPKFSESSLDGYKVRQKYFTTCLDLVAQIENLQSISFPYKIGCNLAGGNWNYYEQIINLFAKKVDADVTIYREE